MDFNSHRRTGGEAGGEGVATPPPKTFEYCKVGKFLSNSISDKSRNLYS